MLVSFEKLNHLIESKGLSFNKLFELGVISNSAARNFREGKDVYISYVAKICRYFNVPIEAVVEVIPLDSEDSSNS